MQYLLKYNVLIRTHFVSLYKQVMWSDNRLSYDLSSVTNYPGLPREIVLSRERWYEPIFGFK